LNIQGWYENINKDNNTLYFISIGGSNADQKGWDSMLTYLNDSTKRIDDFAMACKCRNITGIDWDIENFRNEQIVKVKNICKYLRVQHKFKIMYTILMGTPKWFNPLFDKQDDSHYDYVTLMLYNGGMYQAHATGGGCDWDAWAELFLSKGKPKKYKCIPTFNNTEYITDSNLKNITTSKIILGLRTDSTSSDLNGIVATKEIGKIALKLVNDYRAAGIFFWVIGHESLPKQETYAAINKILPSMGKSKVQKDKCEVDWNSCKYKYTPCVKGGTSCVASFCGKQLQNITDTACSVCTTP
jgi:hypothetical protein